jgi:hypothetical protein
MFDQDQMEKWEDGTAENEDGWVIGGKLLISQLNL